MDLVEVDGVDAEPLDRGLAAAERSAPLTLSFWGIGMNLLAMTTRLRTPGSSASSRPMIRSLSPLP